ncbi:cytochrome-c oxidase, cbb3-type subunit III [Pseudothauera nasutitermitis]|uniref:Cbb3-type cytochrome c oxidase subunit n=1 Tax=Pseudothauera nasutitermitis TaxID=2565930 RepID=A0A4S4B2C4_9RHOO|nr:cytochrome-c oxidase, cbb3-type subunit III [Pseudothauera nasutitermitis]THF65837.1 cytochrome-c oxidase, cbb3-type subunit III [Pseudothauera nasutitermitis]
MADFVSGFWNVYVMGLVALSLLFCVVVLVANMTKRPEKVEVQGHVWDETLQEYNNPLPRWWLYLFWATLIFSVVYLAIFPGFGTTNQHRGQIAQYEAEVARADQLYGPIFARFQEQDLLAVAADPEANAMGQRMFLTYCAQCHGSAGTGAKGFPNLTDSAWNWGGEPETIKTTILHGRIGVMTPFGSILSGEEIKDVANYVRSLSGLANDSLRAQRGKELFDQQCVVCHQADGTGNTLLGAPDLTDSAWLYGSSEATIIETITNGRQNQMPAFADFLGEAKVHILAAYVISLSKGQ